MATVDFKNYLIKILNSETNLDTSEGSNFRDLFINPLSTIFTEYEGEHQKLVDNLSITNPEEMDEQEMDALGARYLVERNEGSYASGYIKVYYSEALPISIPKGTRFTNDATNVTYETVDRFEATRRTMDSNRENGLFYTGEIQIRSVEKQTDSNVKSGTTLSTDLTNPDPEQVVVTTDLSGGEPREDNTSYYRRIKNSVTNSTLASTRVIQDNVKDQSNSIVSAEVVGAGDPLMTRDLVTKNELDPQVVENFQYVDEGQSDDGYYRGHRAFVDTFSFKVSTSETDQDVKWPTSPDEWVTEFNKEQYRGIYKKDDALGASDDYYRIIDINRFDQNNFDEFFLNDGTMPSGELAWPSEIRLDSGQVVLGKTPGDEVIRLTPDELKQLEVDLSDGLDEEEMDLIESALESVQEKRKPENYANVAPIFHKNLKQHTGINIETSMSTTDKTENGEIAYVTVLRNDEIYLPHDGYGLGWRKQPQFLIRLNNNTYSDEELRAQDIATFEDHFGVNPETEGVIGNLSDPANDQYWMYNVYLVDNDILQEEVNLGHNKILDQSSGVNQFLQMSKYWIEPDTTYDFKIQITDNLGTKIWVRPQGDGTNTYDLKIDRGATYPEYVPNAGEKITSDDSDVQALDSTKGHFGIGVGETRSYEWNVESIEVNSIIQSFSMQLFRFNIDTNKWPTVTADFIVDYYGMGYDPDTGNGRTQAVVWHPVNGWTDIGTHTAAPGDTPEEKKLEKEFSDLSAYLTTDDYLYVASSAANFGSGYENDTNHNLESYYIQLRNPLANQKHLHNAIDVYCHSPEDVVLRNSSPYTVSNGEIIITEPYVQDIVEIQEANSKVIFKEDEYDVFNNKRGEEFSKDNEIKITMDPLNDGTEIIVRYRQWSSGSNINNYLNASENRYPGVTIKEKIMPPAVVHIDYLEYRGEPEPEEVIHALVKYINNIENGALEKSDIVNELYSIGATFVDLDMVINIKQYSTSFTYTEHSLDQRYELPTNEKTRFYASRHTMGEITNNV